MISGIDSAMSLFIESFIVVGICKLLRYKILTSSSLYVLHGYSNKGL